jgi:hypothetical protein
MATYLFLLAVQIFGAIWQQLPELRRVAVNPGEQLPYDTKDWVKRLRANEIDWRTPPAGGADSIAEDPKPGLASLNAVFVGRPARE